MVTEGSVMLTSGGGMSMVVSISSGSAEAELMNKERVHLLRSNSKWRKASKEERYP